MFNIGPNNPRQPSPGPTPPTAATKSSARASQTTSMFDLSKRGPAMPHGYIPGALPRPVPVTTPVQSHQPSASRSQLPDTSGGRNRSVSRDHAPKSMVLHEQKIDAIESIVKSIPVGGDKISYAEIMKLLEGYVPLPRQFWDKLVYRQHIRYTKLKDNTFVRGGFITGITTQRGRTVLTLANGFDSRKPGYYTWMIGLNAIAALFVKRDTVEKLTGTHVAQA